MAKQNVSVTTADPVSMYAEQTRQGWRWESGGGWFYSLQWHRKRRVWIARRSAPGHMEVTDGATIQQAIARWPGLPQAVFRRTLRPLGIMR